MKNFINKYGSTFLKGILLFFIIQYFFIPEVYDLLTISVNFTLVLISVIIYICYKRFTNYLSFELLFIISLMLLYYIYPTFVYSEETAYLFSFGLKYDVNCITKGVNIASIGILSFLIGNCKNKDKYCINKIKQDFSIRDNRGLAIFCTVLYIIFYYIGGFQEFKDLYLEGVRESTISSYVIILIQCAFPLLIFNEFWNKKVTKGEYKYSYYSFFLSILIAFHLMIVGSRTNALLIFLPIVVLYAEFFVPQSKKKLLAFFTIGVVLMWLIQNTRAGITVKAKDVEFYYLLSDFFIPNTDTYLAVEVVNDKGCTYGMSVLSQILAIIPFAQGFISSIFGLSLKDTSSSHFFTDYIGSIAGMGTNTVADLFLAFHLFGVILFMYLLGKYCASWHGRLGITYNSSLMYMILSGLSIYLVRSSMFYCLRFFFYSIIISLIFCKQKK